MQKIQKRHFHQQQRSWAAGGGFYHVSLEWPQQRAQIDFLYPFFQASGTFLAVDWLDTCLCPMILLAWLTTWVSLFLCITERFPYQETMFK